MGYLFLLFFKNQTKGGKLKKQKQSQNEREKMLPYDTSHVLHKIIETHTAKHHLQSLAGFLESGIHFLLT